MPIGEAEAHSPRSILQEFFYFSARLVDDLFIFRTPFDRVVFQMSRLLDVVEVSFVCLFDVVPVKAYFALYIFGDTQFMIVQGFDAMEYEQVQFEQSEFQPGMVEQNLLHSR